MEKGWKGRVLGLAELDKVLQYSMKWLLETWPWAVTDKVPALGGVQRNKP